MIVTKRSNHRDMLTDDDELFSETHGDAVRSVRHTHFSLAWILLTIIHVFHSVLAGFALGVQTPLGTPAMFLAVVLYKLFESAAMGAAATKSANATQFMMRSQILAYCLAAPIGMMAGRAFVESSEAPTPVQRALVTALASVRLFCIMCEIYSER